MRRRLPALALCAGWASAQEPLPPSAQHPRAPAPIAALDRAAAQAPAPPGPAARPGGVDAIALAQAMTESLQLARPGPEHARLAALAGEFAVAMTLRPPGLPEEVSVGTAGARSMLGGRYLMVECAVAVPGVRLQGLYLFGFDRMHGLCTASWRDSMSTWSVECSGSPSKEHQDRVELQGTLVDAVSPMGRPFRVDLEFRGDGFAVVVHDTVGDAQDEVMRQVFTRAAAGAAQDPKAEEAEKAEKAEKAEQGK